MPTFDFKKSDDTVITVSYESPTSDKNLEAAYRLILLRSLRFIPNPFNNPNFFDGINFSFDKFIEANETIQAYEENKHRAPFHPVNGLGYSKYLLKETDLFEQRIKEAKSLTKFDIVFCAHCGLYELKKLLPSLYYGKQLQKVCNEWEAKAQEALLKNPESSFYLYFNSLIETVSRWLSEILSPPTAQIKGAFFNTAQQSYPQWFLSNQSDFCQSIKDGDFGEFKKICASIMKSFNHVDTSELVSVLFSIDWKQLNDAISARNILKLQEFWLDSISGSNGTAMLARVVK